MTTETANVNIRFGAEQFKAFRRAITNHHGWSAYQKAHQINIAKQGSKAELLEYARILGIDPAEYAASNNETPDQQDASSPDMPSIIDMRIHTALDISSAVQAARAINPKLVPDYQSMSGDALDTIADLFGVDAAGMRLAYQEEQAREKADQEAQEARLALEREQAHAMAPVPAKSAISAPTSPSEAPNYRPTYTEHMLGNVLPWIDWQAEHEPDKRITEYKTRQVRVINETHALVPAIDKHFAPSKPHMVALRNVSAGYHVFFHGERGTGKSAGAQWIAACLNRPFVTINHNGGTEPLDLLGQRTPAKGGGMEYHEGILTTAVQVPGCVILVDEPSFSRESVHAVYQTGLSSRKLVLAEDNGRVVPFAPGVTFIFADNTDGEGDETGLYTGTGLLNAAFLDRSVIKCEITHLNPEREAHVIHARTGLSLPESRAIARFAATARSKALSGDVQAPVSLRRLLSWAAQIMLGEDDATGFEYAVTNLSPRNDRAFYSQMQLQACEALELARRGQSGVNIMPNAPDNSENPETDQ